MHRLSVGDTSPWVGQTKTEKLGATESWQTLCVMGTTSGATCVAIERRGEVVSWRSLGEVVPQRGLHLCWTALVLGCQRHMDSNCGSHNSSYKC
jgi:hypothetical protein